MHGEFKKDDLGFHAIPWPTGASVSAITAQAWFNMAVCGEGAAAKGHVWFIGSDTSSGQRKPAYLEDMDFELTTDVFWGHQMPEGTAIVSVRLDSATEHVGWSMEVLAIV